MTAVADLANRPGRLYRARAVRSDGSGAVLGVKTLVIRLFTGLGSDPETTKGGGPQFRLQRVFNNRHIENLFREFASLKFFLARDNVREVIVVR